MHSPHLFRQVPTVRTARSDRNVTCCHARLSRSRQRLSAGQDVVIVTYGCHMVSDDPPLVSSEHSRAALFSPAEVSPLVMPDGYKRSVMTWLGLIADGE